MRDRRAYLARLRADGGPSHEVLVLVERHRVLTTDQVARLSGAPVRTVRYRLDRLLAAGLVGYARPGREAGSAPRHWWVTPVGARLVAGVAPAEGKRPSALFAAHAAAIAEVWLAFLEHGPAAGIIPVGWWPDRAGWQQWRPGPNRVGQPRQLTPDAVLTARVAAGGMVGETVAFVEVDLATMSQTQLRAKVGNYLAYAEDRAWDGIWPHCPPLLLLTTTPARARTWIRAAGILLAAHRRARGRDWRFRGRDHGQISEAEQLVVAACGLVRDPAAAVTDPAWLLPADPDDPANPHGPANPVGPVDLAGPGSEPTTAAAATVRTLPTLPTLMQVLQERVTAQAAAAGWYALFAAEADAAARRAGLYDAARDDQLGELLGDQGAAEALSLLVGTDADQFAQAHPDLAEQILTWWPQRHTTHHDAAHTAGDDAGDAAGDAGDQVAAIRAALRVQYRRLWAAQARALLAGAGADPETADPSVHGVAVDLIRGQLVAPWRLDTTDRPRRSVVQAAALGDYPARRAVAVDEQWQDLPRRARRGTSPADLAAAYDQTHLLICDLCAIATPRESPYGFREPGEECWTCGRGHLIDYAHRDTIPTLTHRLHTLRALLASNHPQDKPPTHE